MQILYGLPVVEYIKSDLRKKLSFLDFKPKLAILNISISDQSDIYVRNKQRFGQEVGFGCDLYNLSSDSTNQEIIDFVSKLNKDSSVNGIIVQLPIPNHLDKDLIINSILPTKDVDGLTEENKKLLYSGKKSVVPATARAILSILDFYKIDVVGKNISVFGRSDLVGKPTACLLSQRGGLVSVISSQTKNPKEISLSADIIISAVGKVNLIDKSYIGNKKPIVIDVGINKIEKDDGSFGLCGDVCFDLVKDFVSAITPVPKGVGPVTVASVFENLVDIC